MWRSGAVFFKHFASKNQLPGFYISRTLVENGLSLFTQICLILETKFGGNPSDVLVQSLLFQFHYFAIDIAVNIRYLFLPCLFISH